MPVAEVECSTLAVNRMLTHIVLITTLFVQPLHNLSTCAQLPALFFIHYFALQAPRVKMYRLLNICFDLLILLITFIIWWNSSTAYWNSKHAHLTLILRYTSELDWCLINKPFIFYLHLYFDRFNFKYTLPWQLNEFSLFVASHHCFHFHIKACLHYLRLHLTSCQQTHCARFLHSSMCSCG